MRNVLDRFFVQICTVRPSQGDCTVDELSFEAWSHHLTLSPSAVLCCQREYLLKIKSDLSPICVPPQVIILLNYDQFTCLQVTEKALSLAAPRLHSTPTNVKTATTPLVFKKTENLCVF